MQVSSYRHPIPTFYINWIPVIAQAGAVSVIPEAVDFVVVASSRLQSCDCDSCPLDLGVVPIIHLQHFHH